MSTQPKWSEVQGVASPTHPPQSCPALLLAPLALLPLCSEQLRSCNSRDSGPGRFGRPGYLPTALVFASPCDPSVSFVAQAGLRVVALHVTGSFALCPELRGLDLRFTDLYCVFFLSVSWVGLSS